MQFQYLVSPACDSTLEAIVLIESMDIPGPESPTEEQLAQHAADRAAQILSNSLFEHEGIPLWVGTSAPYPAAHGDGLDMVVRKFTWFPEGRLETRDDIIFVFDECWTRVGLLFTVKWPEPSSGAPDGSKP